MHPSVQIGFVNIEIHHARIWPANLRNIRIAESSSGLCGKAPLLNLFLNIRISAFHHAGNHRMPLAEPLQIRHHFSHRSTGIPFSKPCCDIRMIVIQRLQLLKVHQHDRHIQIFDSRKHVVGSGIGQKLQKYQIHVRCPELIPCSLRLLLRGNHPSVDQFHRIRKRLLKRFILGLKFRHQRRKLRQIRPQRNRKYADFCFRIN